jgi:hypothetical protein
MRTAAQIIDALGGSAALSRETGFPLTTIESWKSANRIPEWRQDRLLLLAAKQGVALSTADFPIKGSANEQAAA